MDMFSIHPSTARTRSIPPTLAHPHSTTIGLADYDRSSSRLARRHAFSRSQLPIVYGEYGVETRDPAGKATLYSGREPSPRPAVDEATQAPTTRRRSSSRACQPTVRMLSSSTSPTSRTSTGLQTRRLLRRTTRRSRASAAVALARRPPRRADMPVAARAVQRQSRRPVRRLHLLPRRPGVAPAAGRGARGGARTRSPRSSRSSRRRFDYAARLLDDRRPARDCDFFLWKITERYEDLGELGAALNATPLAGWLETPYSYLATTKASQYTSARRARKIIAAGLAVPRRLPVREGAPVVRAARGRPAAGDGRAHPHRRDEFPTIHNHTTYSFGIDDQEFMTAFECDEPADFMHLMLTLRESEASRYTERDTPIFVGQHMPIREALDRLDGVGSLVEDHR